MNEWGSDPYFFSGTRVALFLHTNKILLYRSIKIVFNRMLSYEVYAQATSSCKIYVR